MRNSRSAFFILLLLAVVICCPARHAAAQAATTGQLIPEQGTPLVLQFKDIDAGWKQFNLVDENIASFWTLLGSLLKGKDAPPNIFYTQGKLITVGGESYLVAYQQKNASPEPMSLMSWIFNDAIESMGRRGEADGEDPANETKYPPCYTPDPIMPDGAISLCLLNVNTLGKMTDVHAFALAKEMASVNEERMKGVRVRRLYDLQLMARWYNEYIRDTDDGAFPQLATVQDVRELIKDAGLPLKQPVEQLSYLPNPCLAGLTLKDIPTPAETPVFFATHAAVDGSHAVAYLDGHTAVVSGDDWAGLRKKWALPDETGKPAGQP